MVVLRSLSTALSSIARRPALLLPAFALSLISLLGYVTQGSGGSLLVSLAQLFGVPFLSAGFIALIDGARADRGGSGRVGASDPATRSEPTVESTNFVDAGRRYYLTVLGGNVLVGIIYVVVSVVLGGIAVALLGGFGAVLNGSASITPVNVAVIGGLVLLGWLLSLFFQFFEPAAVLEDRRVDNAIGRSVSFVSENYPQVLGFAVVSAVLSGLLELVPMWWVLLDGATTLDGITAGFTDFGSGVGGIGLAALLATSTLSTLLLATYRVCFFTACTASSESAASAPPSDAT